VVGTVLAWATLESTGSLWLAFIVARLIGFIQTFPAQAE
jgi:hypothetical protein